MIKIVIYLFLFTITTTFIGIWILNYDLPSHFEPFKHYFGCSLIGGIGGCLYCFRAIYLNKCVRNNWNAEWQTWYYLRPLVSIICGGVSYLFLQAGLLILEAGAKANANEAGYYALAFIAGFNSGKFLTKIEDIASAVFGIEKSRAALMDQNEKSNSKEK